MHSVQKCHILKIANISETAHKRIEINLNYVDGEVSINIHIAQAIRPAKFLLDSGASLSFLSADIIKSGIALDATDTVNVASATGHLLRTIASVKATMNVHDSILEHKFHIFDRNMSIHADGILGIDFFEQYKCTLDMSSSRFIILAPVCHASVACDSSALLPAHVAQSAAQPDAYANMGHNDTSIDQFPFASTLCDEHNSTAAMKNKNKSEKIFDFPEKKFGTEISPSKLLGDSSIDLYIRKLYTASDQIFTTVPELSIKIVSLKTKLPNGDYVIDRTSLPTALTCTLNSIVRVEQNKIFIAIENSNNFPVNIWSSDFSNICYSKLQNFNILHIKNNISDRFDYIKSKLNLTHCTEQQESLIASLCDEFSDCFFIKGDTINHTDIITHSIELKPDTTPKFVKQYRLPESQKREIQKQLDTMEQEGVIEKCRASGWNSPIILVPKSDESGEKTKFRLVVDFRKLNECTVPIQFPIPHIDTIIDRLANCKFFSTLDLYGAFYQIKLDEKSRQCTTFQNEKFSYRFISMPQGLNTSPAAMQNAANLLLDDLLQKGIEIYLDDIIVFTKTIDEHIILLREIFVRLRKHNFKLKVEKSKFLKKEIDYLGFIINENGCSPNPLKIDCVRNFPQPANVTETQRFLGLCNYYRKFINNYAHIARPLYNTLKKDTSFTWSVACEESFNTLKKALTSPPVLQFPNFEEPFIVTVDASGVAIGGVLSQGQIPHDRPIQYVSRVLNKAQCNYSTIEKEMYAIVSIVTTFRHYLLGFNFILFTDHRPLTYLFNLKNPSGKLYRWRLSLSEYHFKIVYKPGSQNVVADALSRIDYQPIELKSLLNEPENAVVAAITRSRAQAIENANASAAQMQENMSQRKNSHQFFEIEENNNILINSDNIDHIFFLFSSRNCEMKRKIQYKTNTKIDLPADWLPLTPYKLSISQTIFLLPNEINTDARISNTKLLLESILQLCINNDYTEIALNIDFREAKKYFEFKYIFKEKFKNSSIKTTFYLNKVIEVVELDQILDILHMYHSSPLAGHACFEKTKNSIRRYYYWPTMNADIKKFVKTCDICQAAKISRHTKSPMQITSTSDYPFQRIYIDFVNVEREHVNTYPAIFTAMDELTKYAVGVRARNCTASLAARKLVKHVILKHNIPEFVISDLGSAFIADVFKEVTKLFKIKKIFTTPYRPNANIVERFHRTLAQHLIACVHEKPQSWHENLDSAVFAYNNTINSSTGYSPHELIFGYKIKLPDKIINNSNPIYNYENYRDNLRHTLSTYWKIAKANIDARKHKNKEYRDANCNPISLSIGDEVLVRKPYKNHKFATPYDGPYTVEEICSPVTVKIKKGNKSIKIHTDKLKKKVN